MKKVLFFCAWFPNKNNTLAGNFVIEHAKSLNNKVELRIFHVNDDYELKSWFKFEILKFEMLNVYRISFKRFNSLFLYPINVISYFLANIKGYYAIKKDFGIADINHVHVLTKTAVLPYFLKLIYKTPFVISEHWSRYLPQRNSYHGFLRKWITKKIVEKSNGLCTVSNDLMFAMNNHGLKNNNAMIISNVVSDSFFKDYKKKENEKFQFLHVSGLQDAIKNVRGILRVSARLKEEGYKFNLNIVGDDEERINIQKYSNQLNLEGIVKFLGKLHGEDLINQYRNSNAFLLFSNFETQSCVLLESFAVGLPVIATNVGGISEIVNNNNGVLVTSKDENALYQEMKNFIVGKYSFNRDLIKNEAFENYSYHSVSEKILKFYTQALNM